MSMSTQTLKKELEELFSAGSTATEEEPAPNEYPNMRDAGESSSPYPANTGESFAGYMGERLAFDPRRNGSGWR